MIYADCAGDELRLFLKIVGSDGIDVNLLLKKECIDSTTAKVLAILINDYISNGIAFTNFKHYEDGHADVVPKEERSPQETSTAA